MMLNIWSVEKDNSIKHLLLLLRDEFPSIPQQILDPDDTDTKAVRLSDPADPGHSIYIYTYGQLPDHYGVHLEYANQDASAVQDTVEIFDHLSYEQLVALLKVQLNAP